MALEGTGSLSLGTNIFGATRCIRYEILGAYGSYSLSQAITASGLGFTKMTDFYSYAHTSVPAAPSNLSGSYNSLRARIDLTWTDNSGNEDNFRLEVSHNGGGYTFVIDPAANDTSYSGYSPVTAGDNYRFQLRAENAAGNSSWTTSNLVTIPI